MKKLKSFGEYFESGLRRLCGRITPDKRVAAVIVMTLLFGAGSLYMIVSAIYSMDGNDGRRMRIDHIKRFELESSDKTHGPDSLQQFMDQLNRLQDGKEK